MLKKIFFLFSISFFITEISAQGCSDAGLCSISGLKNIDKQSTNNRITFGNSVGLGEQGVLVINPYIQYERRINNHWGVQGKVTSQIASGNLGTAYGLGDFYFTSTYTTKVKKGTMTFLLGAKIFTNQADLTTQYGLGIPMVYQSSLGTIDIISGINYSIKNWRFNLGFQQPITGYNLNTFLPNDWAGRFDPALGRVVSNPLYQDAKLYVPTNHLDRRADALFNVTYNINSIKNLNIILGLLNIYHLGEDTYVDPNSMNGSTEPIPIKGSDGLTLNGTVTLWYRINKKISIGCLFGTPFLVRDVRPDGLTRSVVFAPELVFNF